jgi:hypothetical protein
MAGYGAFDFHPPARHEVRGRAGHYDGTFQSDGSMIGQSAGQTSLWRWQQSGSSAQWSNGNTIYTASITGNHMVGTISYGQHTGNFEASR